ncbi:MAG: hypothetical protein NTX06_01325 [Proteobacteria bacterium]|nr:hypothetical protein [Pseudomonadota bacterium]
MSRKTKHITTAKTVAARSPAWWITGLIILAVVAVSGYWMWEKSAAPTGPDTSKLIGKWLRPDGGYVLALSDIKNDGTLTASYFNPNPIKVFRSEWSSKKGTINLFVELRDVNYPGSTYTLNYDPVTDQLTGIYFQAALKQQFEVVFARKK